MLTPNPNECNSTLTSGTKHIYPYPYIDVNDRGHRLRICQAPRRLPLPLTKLKFLVQDDVYSIGCFISNRQMQVNTQKQTK